MKIFARLFSGIILILSVLLIVSGVLLVNTNLKINLDFELENSIKSHHIMQDLIHTRIILATKNKQATEEIINQAVKEAVGVKNIKLAVKMNDTLAYNEIGEISEHEDRDDGNVIYDLKERDGKVFYEISSCFILRTVKYSCITLSDITDVINENNKLRHRYRLIYFIVLAAGACFALCFSMYITKPVRRLVSASKAIAEGDYTKRLPAKSDDEIGQLTNSYNRMAEIIEEKVEELELSVRQKEDFIAAFAHETKTPMTSIIGYADLIYQGRLDAAECREASEIILNEGLRLQALSYKLLDLSSLDHSGIRYEDINSIDMQQNLEKTVKDKAQKAEIELCFEDEYLRVDYDLIKTVLLNLIDNSLKAGAKKITVTGEKCEEASYSFTVADDGSGIPEEQLERVKEAFYMVDKSRSRKNHGAGIGLALCDRIVRFHGGSMTIANRIQGGTEVKIVLPLINDENARKNEEKHT